MKLRKPSEREWQLAEEHQRLMLEEGHEGSAHCQCQAATEFMKLYEERLEERRIKMEEWRANRKRKLKSDIQESGC